jgi:CHAP domain
LYFKYVAGRGLFEHMEILFQKRWILIASVFIVVDLFLVSLLGSAAQAHHASTAGNHDTSNASVVPAHTYDDPNIITDGMLMLTDNISQTVSTARQRVVGGTESISLGVIRGERSFGHGIRVSTTFALQGVIGSFVFMMHAIGGSFAFVGHLLGGGFSITGHTIVGSVALLGHVVFGSFAFVGHTIGSVFGFVSGVTHVGSVIRPVDHTPAPRITQLRAQQAAMIQKGTVDVAVASMINGTGGACDNGAGNGGYPMKWCNALMDSVATVPYSGDPINRECTSYAYWYFTNVEGHTDFKAWGNAKYWATTSNYATHTIPAVGAIAVETAGAYGHVAIVQALPGQKYAGKVVPAGNVLVSEMNYDWNGHFRYSYSPLSKFSAYIYP